jgi:hypothetical protein
MVGIQMELLYYEIQNEIVSRFEVYSCFALMYCRMTGLPRQCHRCIFHGSPTQYTSFTADEHGYNEMNTEQLMNTIDGLPGTMFEK